MKYGLEHLTKEQLIQITQMYMDDVDTLKNEVNRLNDLLFKHENNYKKLINQFNALVKVKEELTESNAILYFNYKKQKALSDAACKQAYRAKRKIPVINYHVNVHEKEMHETEQRSDDFNLVASDIIKYQFEKCIGNPNNIVDIDVNGFYKPKK